MQQPGRPGEDPGDVFLSDCVANGFKDDVVVEQHIADDHFAVKAVNESISEW
jgi:hypothetical protein